VLPKLPFLPLRLRRRLLQLYLLLYRCLLLLFPPCTLSASCSCTALPACLLNPPAATSLYSTHQTLQPSPAQHCDLLPPPTPHYCAREDSPARQSVHHPGPSPVASTLSRQAPAHPQPLYRATCYTGCLVLCFARLRSTLSAVRSRAGANPLVIAGRFLLPQSTYLPSSPYPAGSARQLWCNLTSRDGHAARSPQCLAQCSLSSPDTYCPGRQP
jgi:hypothetical protein